ncbi:glycosyltransferase [Rhodococcus phage Reynauld]|uniref:Glycosyltransferase n=1 Tax=Rhodococcus phage Reynauld TaxID=3062845 RepID=A0ACD4UHA8_9CAUD|nr:glycosyltransferase [Rhodococcus phage Reynauld]
MSDNGIELTDETRTMPDGTLVSRIRTTIDRAGRHGFSRAKAGDLGGWAASADSFRSQSAWVSDEAVIGPDVVLEGAAMVYRGAVVVGETRLEGRDSDGAAVSNTAVVAGPSVIDSTSSVHGRVRAFGVRLGGNATLGTRTVGTETVRALWARLAGTRVITTGDADAFVANIVMTGGCISDGAVVQHNGHVLTVGPVGSENVTATLYRAANPANCRMVVGCWDGELSELPAEVKRRTEDEWIEMDADEFEVELWGGEYETLQPLLEMRARYWLRHETVPEGWSPQPDLHLDGLYDWQQAHLTDEMRRAWGSQVIM